MPRPRPARDELAERQIYEAILARPSNNTTYALSIIAQTFILTLLFFGLCVFVYAPSVYRRALFGLIRLLRLIPCLVRRWFRKQHTAPTNPVTTPDDCILVFIDGKEVLLPAALDLPPFISQTPGTTPPRDTTIVKENGQGPAKKRADVIVSSTPTNKTHFQARVIARELDDLMTPERIAKPVVSYSAESNLEGGVPASSVSTHPPTLLSLPLVLAVIPGSSSTKAQLHAHASVGCPQQSLDIEPLHREETKIKQPPPAPLQYSSSNPPFAASTSSTGSPTSRGEPILIHVPIHKGPNPILVIHPSSPGLTSNAAILGVDTVTSTCPKTLDMQSRDVPVSCPMPRGAASDGPSHVATIVKNLEAKLHEAEVETKSAILEERAPAAELMQEVTSQISATVQHNDELTATPNRARAEHDISGSEALRRIRAEHDTAASKKGKTAQPSTKREETLASLLKQRDRHDTVQRARMQDLELQVRGGRHFQRAKIQDLETQVTTSRKDRELLREQNEQREQQLQDTVARLEEQLSVSRQELEKSSELLQKKEEQWAKHQVEREKFQNMREFFETLRESKGDFVRTEGNPQRTSSY